MSDHVKEKIEKLKRDAIAAFRAAQKLALENQVPFDLLIAGAVKLNKAAYSNNMIYILDTDFISSTLGCSEDGEHVDPDLDWSWKQDKWVSKAVKAQEDKQE